MIGETSIAITPAWVDDIIREDEDRRRRFSPHPAIAKNHVGKAKPKHDSYDGGRISDAIEKRTRRQLRNLLEVARRALEQS